MRSLFSHSVGAKQGNAEFRTALRYGRKAMRAKRNLKVALKLKAVHHYRWRGENQSIVITSLLIPSLATI
jgi:hypothetical protein